MLAGVQIAGAFKEIPPAWCTGRRRAARRPCATAYPKQSAPGCTMVRSNPPRRSNRYTAPEPPDTPRSPHGHELAVRGAELAGAAHGEVAVGQGRQRASVVVLDVATTGKRASHASGREPARPSPLCNRLLRSGVEPSAGWSGTQQAPTTSTTLGVRSVGIDEDAVDVEDDVPSVSRGIARRRARCGQPPCNAVRISLDG